MHAMLYDGRMRIELRSPAAQREGGVHNIQFVGVTGPNVRGA